MNFKDAVDKIDKLAARGKKAHLKLVHYPEMDGAIPEKYYEYEVVEDGVES
jgi:hypothetical protein